MRPARGVLVAGSIGVMVGLGLGGALKATPAEAGRTAPTPEIRLDCGPFPITEDAAAHPQLEVYSSELIVYRCSKP